MGEFIAATKSHPELFESELDLLGKYNFVVAGNKGDERLLVLDPHLRSVEGRSTETRQKIERRFEGLENIYEEANIQIQIRTGLYSPIAMY